MHKKPDSDKADHLYKAGYKKFSNTFQGNLSTMEVCLRRHDDMLNHVHAFYNMNMRSYEIMFISIQGKDNDNLQSNYLRTHEKR